MLKQFIALSGLLSLAACGGGGGGTGPSSFDDYRSESLSLAAEIDSEDALGPDEVPTSGRVAYDGPLIVGVIGGVLNDRVIAGDMSLDVNFGSNEITGGASDFVDDLNRPYSGSLDVTSGLIVRSGALNGVATGELGGTLTNTSVGVVDVDAAFLGAFVDDGAEYLTGIVGGDVRVNGLISELDGAIILED